MVLVTDADPDTLNSGISSLKEKDYIESIVWLKCKNNAGTIDMAPVEAMLDGLRLRHEYKLFAIEDRDIAVFISLQKDYKFDVMTMSFQVRNNSCDALRYISKRPFISVHDLISFNSAFVEENQPEFFTDYQILWDLYYDNTYAWKKICDGLGDYDKSISTIAKFSRNQQGGNDTEFKYILPIGCMNSVERILSFLKGNGIIKSASNVDPYTSDSCLAKIKATAYCKSRFDELFSHIYFLMLPDSLNTIHSGDDYMITYNSLEVKDWGMFSALKKAASVENYAELKNESFELLKEWSKRGYIFGLSYKKNGIKRTIDERTKISEITGPISFIYASEQIKQLFVSSGRMLEVYLFHKLQASNLFDDVTSGYKIKWNITAPNGNYGMNEIDCILTKGFQSAIIECKARDELNKEFYKKLSEIGQRLGVNAKMILVADTDIYDMQNNSSVTDYGKQIGVTTLQISDNIADDINSLFS